MEEKEKKELAQGCLLVCLLTVAVIVTAVCVGMFFGAQWGVLVVAVFAVFEFFFTRRNIKKERRSEHGEEE